MREILLPGTIEYFGLIILTRWRKNLCLKPHLVTIVGKDLYTFRISIVIWNVKFNVTLVKWFYVALRNLRTTKGNSIKIVNHVERCLRLDWSLKNITGKVIKLNVRFVTKNWVTKNPWSFTNRNIIPRETNFRADYAKKTSKMARIFENMSVNFTKLRRANFVRKPSQRILICSATENVFISRWKISSVSNVT